MHSRITFEAKILANQLVPLLLSVPNASRTRYRGICKERGVNPDALDWFAMHGHGKREYTLLEGAPEPIVVVDSKSRGKFHGVHPRNLHTAMWEAAGREKRGRRSKVEGPDYLKASIYYVRDGHGPHAMLALSESLLRPSVTYAEKFFAIVGKDHPSFAEHTRIVNEWLATQGRSG